MDSQSLTPKRESMAKRKETIIPPNKRELADASPEMRKGHSAGARTMADASVAKRQGAKRGKGGK
jgi:hypothetical protein